MPIFEVETNRLRKIEETSFTAARVRERKDLQRLLRQQIEIIVPDVLILAEEFGGWDDSHRRIDLLGIDKAANLVVIELKRTEDGGHMELQALRYAAMVSTMTFEEALRVYATYLQSASPEKDAAAELLEFLGWDEPDEDRFAQDVRIVLASAEFSKEITSSVLWLNTYGIDVRCIRMKPYKDGDRILIEVEQVLPLPEASDYQIRIGIKNKKERKARSSAKDSTKYDILAYGVTRTGAAKQDLMFFVVKSLHEHGVTPERIMKLIKWRPRSLYFVVDGDCDSAEFIKLAAGRLGANGKLFDAGRWFLGENELIRQSDKTYAFTNSWGFRWIEAIDILRKAFPEANIEYKRSQQM